MSDYNISVSEGVSLVTVQGAPADLCFVSSLFEALADRDINVDMISQSPPQGAFAPVSFTILEAKLPDCLELLAKLREANPAIRPLVCHQNCKVLVKGEKMRNTRGVAAAVFRAAAQAGTDVRLVTTAETEISLLISDSGRDTFLAELEKINA
ncbi:MAG: hypothetical protein LBQ48_05580 [Oscillospiraceae bacterium]|jgi:aspartate kinase|nr:hypothetical protein [Oscillospiraceae bacterium]